MVWGGSLNKDGSDYLRKLRNIENVIKFLENLKEQGNSKEKEHISTTINLIIKVFKQEQEESQQDL
ncbi:MAG: hypothetical protein ACFFAO_04620 [Candidatus Hermodarchaeota archaeon]